MAILDRLFKARPKAQAPQNTTTHSTVDFFTMGFTVDDIDTIQGQAREGYKNNPYVFRACQYYKSFISIPDALVQDAEGNKLENHPLSYLLDRPTPMMSGKEFKGLIGLHLGIYGEAFVYPVWTIKGVEQLNVLDPYDMTVIETGDRLNPVREYVYNRGQAGVMHFQPDEIIHIRLYNPDGCGARGMSPMVAAKRSVEMQNSIRDWNISTTKNGAKTSLIIEVPRAITAEQHKRMTDQMNQSYGGKSNAGKGMILDDGKKASTVGMTAVEMDFIQGIAVGARELAVAYGVASEMLGDAQNKTYSNMLEANRQTIQTTAIPLLQLVYDALTIGILRNPKHPNAYPDVHRITYDPEQINDVTVDKAQLYSQMEQATYLTINEKREKLGYDPIEDPMADTPLVNMGLGPLSDVALDDEPVISDELPYLQGDGTITENLARIQNQPKEEPKAPTFQHLVNLGQGKQ